MTKNYRKKSNNTSQTKLNQSVVNDSKSSDSSNENDTLNSNSTSCTFQTIEDLSRLGTDFSNLSTSGGSTSTPIYDRNESRLPVLSQIETSTPLKSPIRSNKNKHNNNPQNDSDSRFPIKTSVLGVCIAIILGALLTFGLPADNKSKLDLIETDKLEMLIDEIKAQFQLTDENIWDDFYVGISNRQAVFLLIYSDNGIDAVYKLSQAVGKIAVAIIKSNDIQDPIVVSYRHLNTEPYLTDHGKLITKYRTELEHSGVLIVHDLDLVRGSVARAFHTICDQYNPLVEQSVIIFTMRVNDLDGKATEIGEKRLNEVWSEELEVDVLTPLVTRLTANVLKVQ